MVLYSSSACPNVKPPSTNLFITSSYPYCVCQDVNALKVGPLNVTTPVWLYILFVNDVESLNPHMIFGWFLI